MMQRDDDHARIAYSSAEFYARLTTNIYKHAAASGRRKQNTLAPA